MPKWHYGRGLTLNKPVQFNQSVTARSKIFTSGLKLIKFGRLIIAVLILKLRNQHKFENSNTLL